MAPWSLHFRNSPVPLAHAVNPMRRVLLISSDHSSLQQATAVLPMDECVWETGYPLIMHPAACGMLQAFWQHYYGASAELQLSGEKLLEFRTDIMAALPQCDGAPDVRRFLQQLAAMCLRAHANVMYLQVIAD